MADAGFFKGTSAEQDRRFSDKELKLMKSMKFPPEFEKKVDMRKVNLTVIRPWIAKKIVDLIGFEDEVVIEYAMGLLEDEQNPTPDPRKMQIALTGFLTKDTPVFMADLWKLLLEAQEEISGVPRTFVEQKKEELRKARENDVRAIDERDRRTRLDEVRDGSRFNNRGGDRGRGRGNGGRGRGGGRGGGRGFDDDRNGGRPRDSGWGNRGGGKVGRSPRRDIAAPSRRRSRSRTPRNSSGSPPPGKRYRSPPRPRSVSRSRTPPARRPSPRGRGPSRRSPSPSSSRSRSRTPPPSKRRARSPSTSPPPYQRDRKHGRDSRSPPSRRRRLSPGARPHSQSTSRSRSRSPPPRSRRSPVRRARSASRSSSPSASRRKRSPGRSRSRTPRRRSPNPERRRGGRDARMYSRSSSGSRTKSSRSRSPPPRERERQQDRRRDNHQRDRPRGSGRNNDAMDVDRQDKQNDAQELKIRGQAAAERKTSRWDDEEQEPANKLSAADLEKRENELKEKALRNKVIRTRKAT